MFSIVLTVTVLSLLPEAIYRPPGLKATPLTWLVCPLSVITVSSLFASRTVMIFPPQVTIQLSSGDHFTPTPNLRDFHYSSPLSKFATALILQLLLFIFGMFSHRYSLLLAVLVIKLQLVPPSLLNTNFTGLLCPLFSI